MSMQKKPQMAEAVLFFNDSGVCKEMLYPEFEALLDGLVRMPEYADRQMHLAYVLINPRLQARIDQHIGQVHLPVGVFRHAHQAIEQRLEFGIQHFLADAAVVEEQHGLRHLWLFLHAHR